MESRRAVGVVVGVGNYVHPDLTPLPFAVPDSKAMARALRRADTCRFPYDQVALLTNRDARHAGLRTCLFEWLPARSASAELVVFYFAGHGMLTETERGDEGFLLPHDADPSRVAETGLSMTELASCMDALSAETVVVFLDCCHSGKILFRDATAPSGPPLRRNFTPSALGSIRGKGRFLLTSCDEGQVSLETDVLEHGLFTHHLLQGIEGAADRDRDGKVGIGELFDYVSTVVRKDARERFYSDQHPWYDSQGSGGVFISVPRIPRAASTHSEWQAAPPLDPLAAIQQSLDSDDEAGLVASLRQLETLEALESVPYALHCLQHRSGTVQRAAASLIEAFEWPRVASHLDDVIKRQDERLIGYILDGLTAITAHQKTIQLLDRVVRFLHGELRNRAIRLLDRKRLSLGQEKITRLFNEIKSNFEIQDVLGQGTFTASYRARSVASGFDVVVRALRHEFVDLVEIKDGFVKLALKSWRLHHQNLGRTLDVRTFDDERIYFTVRDYIPGVSLQQILDKDKTLPPGKVVRILAQISSALDVVHAADLFHGGIKPTNIFVTPDGAAVLGDLSIPLHSVPVSPERLCYDYRYVAPEMLVRNEPLGPWSDFYSLGCVAYELLCGEPPFTSEHDQHNELILKHLTERIPPISQRGQGISTAWDTLIARMVVRDTDQRYATAAAMRAALNELEQQQARESGRDMTGASGAMFEADFSKYLQNDSIVAFPQPDSTIHPSQPKSPSAQERPSAGTPRRIGKYEIIELLGKGGMGNVYKARDPMLDRLVALKTLGSGLADDNVLVERFHREARAAARLNHPNLVTIYDVGVVDGQPYIAMELLSGEDLRRMIDRRHELTLENSLRWMIEICSGLAHAHERGVIHRDIKPGNILVTAEGSAKILDFGIARLVGSNVTNTGDVLGTPIYMSPEQIVGEKVDGRSDIYACGATFYELVSGRRPFAAESITTLFYEILHHDPEPIDRVNPLIPHELSEAIGVAIRRAADQRFQSATAFRDRLVQIAALLEDRKPQLRASLVTSTAELVSEVRSLAGLLSDAGISGPWHQSANPLLFAPDGSRAQDIARRLDPQLDYLTLAELERSAASERDRVSRYVKTVRREGALVEPGSETGLTSALAVVERIWSHCNTR